MSSKSKALIGGALAVIFVITMFNTNAIVSLSNKVNSALSQKVAYNGDVMEEYYVDQQAALGTVGMDTPEPDHEGVHYEYWGALCARVSDGGSVPGTTYYDADGERQCDTDHPGFANPGSGQSIIHVDPMTGQLTISGTTTSAATAMKLYALGYVNRSTDLSGVLKSFQRDNGISQTGTAGKLTIAALDAKVKNLKVWKTEMAYEIYSQDHASVKQQAALGTVGADVPEPEPEGRRVTVSLYNGIANECTVYWTNTGTGASGSYTYSGPCVSTAAQSGLLPMNINPTTGAVTINGTGISSTAFKLSLLGYMDGQSKMAPLSPNNISEEIKAFQKHNGISQTGTAGRLTTSALDAKIANLRAKLFEVKYYRTSSNDPTEYPEDAEIFYRYPEQ